jgi:hypothetical protein
MRQDDAKSPVTGMKTRRSHSVSSLSHGTAGASLQERAKKAFHAEINRFASPVAKFVLTLGVYFTNALVGFPNERTFPRLSMHLRTAFLDADLPQTNKFGLVWVALLIPTGILLVPGLLLTSCFPTQHNIWTRYLVDPVIFLANMIKNITCAAVLLGVLACTATATVLAALFVLVPACVEAYKMYHHPFTPEASPVIPAAYRFDAWSET